MTILQQFLNESEDDEEFKNQMNAHPDLTQSNLWQIAIPEECIGKTFEQLFYYLLEKKMVTIALYR